MTASTAQPIVANHQANHQHAEPAGPCVMVILGGTGDLTRRLLTPSLYNLAEEKLLPKNFAIVGFAYPNLSHEDFQAQVKTSIEEYFQGAANSDIQKWFLDRVSYVQSDFNDPKGYGRLKDELARVDQEHGTKGNYLFYMATAPEFFMKAPQQLSNAGLLKESEGQWRRVVIEKPFGRDLDSARALNQQLACVLKEDQIYRIDHYLGKETVQNIMALRFANGIFEPLWNRRYIDHVQITVAETVGVEGRGGYFDHAGTLRDMTPNHVMQLITLIAMEPPASFSPDAVHDEQVKVLHSIPHLSEEDAAVNAVRGQYGPGKEDGKDVPGYRQEKSVRPDSPTETYAAIKLAIDNWRWADVPFYLRTGKRLSRRDTEIAIKFRRAPFRLFRQTEVSEMPSNCLVLQIQPAEGISLGIETKVPGPKMELGRVDMAFRYADYFGKEPRTGYETLLYDCMIGDKTLFQRADMIENGWSVIGPVLSLWEAEAPKNFPNYAAGSAGPAEADELLARDGREWRKIEVAEPS